MFVRRGIAPSVSLLSKLEMCVGFSMPLLFGGFAGVVPHVPVSFPWCSQTLEGFD